MGTDFTTWAIIPARGGSKSIPLKNIAPLAGRLLIDYGAKAGLACPEISRVLCSTDHDGIAERCATLGVDVHRRPDDLAGDATPVNAVIAHLLDDLEARGEILPDAFALIQPTSPFLRPEDLSAGVAALRADPAAGSFQNVSQPPHNHHAFNQRTFDADGRVKFYFEKERAVTYNKQTKPTLFLFGNIIITRTEAFRASGTVFAAPSVGVEIDHWHAFDADGPQDFRLAEVLLREGFVSLPHLD